MKIVTLIPSATEIVAFLGQKKSIVGRSHECDYPKDLNKITKLTTPKINVNGSSSEINKEISNILENSLSVYKVNIEELKKLNPDFIITQAHCEVCAVSFNEVKNIVNKYLDKKTKIISLEPNNLNDVFNDFDRVAKNLNIKSEKNTKLINNLKNKLQKIQSITNLKKKKPTVACIEWIDPLMIAGNWIPEMVKIAGGKNLMGKPGNNSHWIKFEELLKQDPEIIIFMPCGFDINKTRKDLKNYLEKNKNLLNLNSYKKNKFFVVDGNQFFNRPGPRLIDSVEILAEIINPEIFGNKYKTKGWINFND